MIIAVFAFALLLHLIEASYEAQRGDKNHWISITVSFIIHQFFCFLIGFSPLPAVVAWCGVRAYFDLMFNYFKGNHWAYLGSSITDGMLKWMNGYVLLAFRVLFSLLCVIYVIWKR